MSWQLENQSAIDLVRKIASIRNYDDLSLVVPSRLISCGDARLSAVTCMAIMMPHFVAFHGSYRDALGPLQSNVHLANQFLDAWATVVAGDDAERVAPLKERLVEKWHLVSEYTGTVYGRLDDRLRITRAFYAQNAPANIAFMVEPELLRCVAMQAGSRWSDVLTHTPISMQAFMAPAYAELSSAHRSFVTLMMEAPDFCAMVTDAVATCCADDEAGVAAVKARVHEFELAWKRLFALKNTLTIPPVPLYLPSPTFVATTPAPAPAASAAETTASLVAPVCPQPAKDDSRVLVANRWATFRTHWNKWVWQCACGHRMSAPGNSKTRIHITTAVGEHVRQCSDVSPSDWLSGLVMTMHEKFPAETKSVGHVCHHRLCTKYVDSTNICQQTYGTYGWATFFCDQHPKRDGSCVNCKRSANFGRVMHFVPWRNDKLQLCDFCINLRTTQAQLTAAESRESPAASPEAKRTKQ